MINSRRIDYMLKTSGSIMSEIVKLNVGGTKFYLSKTSINNLPSSLLYTMINSPMSHTYDDDQCIFICRDPKYFPLILKIYRDKIYPKFSELNDDLMRELEYYCIDLPIGQIIRGKRISCGHIGYTISDGKWTFNGGSHYFKKFTIAFGDNSTKKVYYCTNASKEKMFIYYSDNKFFEINNHTNNLPHMIYSIRDEHHVISLKTHTEKKIGYDENKNKIKVIVNDEKYVKIDTFANHHFINDNEFSTLDTLIIRNEIFIINAADLSVNEETGIILRATMPKDFSIAGEFFITDDEIYYYDELYNRIKFLCTHNHPLDTIKRFIIDKNQISMCTFFGTTHTIKKI